MLSPHQRPARALLGFGSWAIIALPSPRRRTITSFCSFPPRPQPPFARPSAQNRVSPSSSPTISLCPTIRLSLVSLLETHRQAASKGGTFAEGRDTCESVRRWSQPIMPRRPLLRRLQCDALPAEQAHFLDSANHRGSRSATTGQACACNRGSQSPSLTPNLFALP